MLWSVSFDSILVTILPPAFPYILIICPLIVNTKRLSVRQHAKEGKEIPACENLRKKVLEFIAIIIVGFKE
jgi:hypothetical protein